jgi:hypothetical protein
MKRKIKIEASIVRPHVTQSKTWLTFQAGLPDGIFSIQKSQFGKICEGLALDDFGLFYGHLVYFWPFMYYISVAIWYMLWLFGKSFPVLVCCTKKNLANLVSSRNLPILEQK